MIPGIPCNINFFKNSLNTQEVDLFAKQIAEFLKELHATPLSIIKECKIEQISSSEALKIFKSNTQKHVINKLTKEEQILVKNFFENFLTLIKDSPMEGLTHGDLNWDHLLISESNKTLQGIIDFTDVVFSDIAVDFSGLWIYGESFVKKVINFYAPAADANLLERSKLYYKKVALVLMIESQKGTTFTYEEGYSMFIDRFIGKN